MQSIYAHSWRSRGREHVAAFLRCTAFLPSHWIASPSPSRPGQLSLARWHAGTWDFSLFRRGANGNIKLNQITMACLSLTVFSGWIAKGDHVTLLGGN